MTQTTEQPRLRLVHGPDEDAHAGGLSGLVATLLAALGRWQVQLTQLVEITERKLAAMRRADVTAMHACMLEEAAALEIVAGGEQERRAILAALAQRLHLPEQPMPPLAMITDKLDEPESSHLRAKTLGLRELAERLKKRNGLAAVVARSLQSHVRAALADVSGANQSSIGYGPSGRVEQRITRSWVDAVG